MVTEIQSSKNETLKSTNLDVLRGVNVNDFIERQSNLGKLKHRVADVGCMPLGRIFKTETRMWSWFEDFLLIKLVLRHGYSYLDDVIDDPIWQLCTPRIQRDKNGAPSFVEEFNSTPVNEVIKKLMFKRCLRHYVAKDSSSLRSLSKKCFGASYNQRISMIQ